MAKMADAVKTFYATLTPEQQTAFDKIHKSHMSHMGHMK
jgi:Spy/CpxP family protein refolding chaperone